MKDTTTDNGQTMEQGHERTIEEKHDTRIPEDNPQAPEARQLEKKEQKNIQFTESPRTGSRIFNARITLYGPSSIQRIESPERAVRHKVIGSPVRAVGYIVIGSPVRAVRHTVIGSPVKGPSKDTRGTPAGVN